MKTIQPVSVWQDGQLKTATKLHVISSYDDLNTFANFSYTMQQEPPENSVPPAMYSTVASGTVNINGQDYQDWDDSNDGAYAYVAQKLNLTIVVPE